MIYDVGIALAVFFVGFLICSLVGVAGWFATPLVPLGLALGDWVRPKGKAGP